MRPHLIYNYRLYGDVLLHIIEPSLYPTSTKRINDVVFLYNQEKLIGINFFGFSSLIKIHVEGRIFLPFPSMITCLNQVLTNTGSDLQFENIVDSCYRIGKIIDIKDKLISVDLKDSKVYANNVLEAEIKLNDYVVVLLEGALQYDGSEARAIHKDGKTYLKIATELDLGISAKEEIYFIKDETLQGEDFFLLKGGNYARN